MSLAPAIPGTATKTVCYLTNWRHYRPGITRYMPENVDPCLCTHITYTFAGIANNQIKTTEWNDEASTASKTSEFQARPLCRVGGFHGGPSGVPQRHQHQNVWSSHPHATLAVPMFCTGEAGCCRFSGLFSHQILSVVACVSRQV